jgi:hypothetical protein
LAPDPGLDVWISTTQACGILGIKRTAMSRLLDGAEPLLVVRRPLPTKILVSLRSVKEFAEATKNPAFWESTELQAEYRRKMKEIPNA